MRKSAVLLLLVATACEPEAPQRLVGQLASDRLELVAEVAEPIVARHVSEGERVAAGTVVVELDTARIDTRIRGARARVAELEARLAELLRGPRSEQIAAARATVEGARRDVEFRRLEYNRAREVREKNLNAQDDVDRAEAALDTAAATLDAAEARLDELLTGTTVEELRQAEERLEQARADLAQLDVDRDRLSIESPQDGVIDALPFESGERPPAGATVAVLLAGEQPHARIYVPEGLRVRVTPGTRARVFVDGLARPLDGRVAWVSSDAAFTPYFALTEHDRGRLSYVAEIDLEHAGERLPDGVPVEVELEIADVE